MQKAQVPELHLVSALKNIVYFNIHTTKNSSITHYNIDYKQSDSGTWNSYNTTKGTSQIFKLQFKFHSFILIPQLMNFFTGKNWDKVYELPNLKENIEYSVRARSINALGVSDFSQELKFTAAFASRFMVSSTVFFVSVLLWLL